MTDWYIEDTARLQEQPKLTIADYVESNGILVPRRFASLEDARISGIDFLGRSEHEQDHNGVSGLLRSYRKDSIQDVSSEDQLLDYFFEEEIPYDINAYCKLLGMETNTLRDQTSFSFWEYIEGHNITIIADSAISERHHIVIDRGNFENYSVFEKGRQISSFIKELPEELLQEIPKWIEQYEKIRQLDRFDLNHCPIMEMQRSLDGNLYFLQYHRTRDFSAPTFTLDREKEKGEIEALFVRGATKGAFECEATVFYRHEDIVLSDSEDSSFGSREDVFEEIMLRRRKVQLIRRHSKLNNYFPRIVGHSTKSELFKPEVSLCVKPFDLFSVDEWRHHGEHGGTISLRIISDGEKAFVKRVA